MREIVKQGTVMNEEHEWEDPAQRQRLEAADRRRDDYPAREVGKGVEPEFAQEKPQEESGRGEGDGIGPGGRPREGNWVVAAEANRVAVP